MGYVEIKELLEKYGWVLESISPLNISSKDGEHSASNFCAEVVIEYFINVDQSDNEEYKTDLINRFNSK